MKLYLLSMYKNLQILATLGSSSWISSAACNIASIMVVRASEGGTAPAMPLDVLSWPWPSSRFNVAPTNLSQLLVTRDIVYNNDIWRIKSWCRGFWSLTCEMFFFRTGLNCIGREIDRKGYDQFLNWKNLRKIGEEREREREVESEIFLVHFLTSFFFF